MDELKIIGAKCRKLRRERDLTLEHVASLFGCSPSNIAKFEKGENNNLLYYIFASEFDFNIDAYNAWRGVHICRD